VQLSSNPASSPSSCKLDAAAAAVVVDSICLIVPVDATSDGGCVQILSVSEFSRRFVTERQGHPAGWRHLRISGGMTSLKDCIDQRDAIFDGPSVAFHVDVGIVERRNV